jgi:hypothetical protein
MDREWTGAYATHPVATYHDLTAASELDVTVEPWPATGRSGACPERDSCR